MLKRQIGISPIIVIILVTLVIGLVTSGYYVKRHFDRAREDAQIAAQQAADKALQATQISVVASVATTNAPKPSPPLQPVILLDIPFTVQAPFAEWSNPHLQDACEEASVLMVMHWVKGEPIGGPQAAKDEILAISQYEEDTFGSYYDTSASDTAKHIIEGYYHYTNYEMKPVTSINDIVTALEAGQAVIVPANGQALGNRNFTQPGPERHMLVIKGYDRQKKQFITNETGIRQGENWRYDENVLFTALRDYTTGHHAPIVGDSKVMIVVKR